MSGIRLRRAAAAAADSPIYLERQAAIRAAAGEVFREKGFHATKLNDVAERAGMDRASLYYYVGSKDDLFREVISRSVAANVADAERIAASPAPARDKLAQVVTLLMIAFERDYPYMHVFVQEDTSKLARGIGASAEAWAPTLQQSHRYFEVVKDIVAEGLESGDLQSTLPAAVIANSLIGMMTSSHLWYRPDGQMNASELGQGMAKMLLSGLQAGRRAKTASMPITKTVAKTGS